MAKQLIRIADGQKILVSSDDSYYYEPVKEELTMSVAYKIPRELEESLGDVASSQMIDVLNHFAEIQRNGWL